MRVFDYPAFLELGDMSADITSQSQQLVQMAMCAIQAAWTGAPVGSLKLQISNDNVIWSDYTGSDTAVSGAGDFMWNLTSVGFPYIRVVYTRTSGTGVLNVNINGKGV